jgi:hypothetical protein
MLWVRTGSAYAGRERPLNTDRPRPSILSITLLGLPDFDLRLFRHKFLGYEGNPHPPAGMDTKKPPEFVERQLFVVDLNRDFTLGSAVVDDAAEQVTARQRNAAAKSPLAEAIRYAPRRLER